MHRLFTILALCAWATVAYADSEGSVTGGTRAPRSTLSGCTYNSTPPVLTNGQQAATQCDSSGNQIISGSVTTTVAMLPATTTQGKVTIAVTNTFQQALAANATRKGCLLQNNGTNSAYVFFGTAVPSDLTTSFKLAAAQAISCAVGGIAVATDKVQVTGTAADVVVVSEQ